MMRANLRRSLEDRLTGEALSTRRKTKLDVAELPLLLEYLESVRNAENSRSLEKRGWRSRI